MQHWPVSDHAPRPGLKIEIRINFKLKRIYFKFMNIDTYDKTNIKIKSYLTFNRQHKPISYIATNMITNILLGNFPCVFLSSADFFFFKIIVVFKNSLRNTISMSTSLDPDQARRIVGPDLGPNCLPRLSADDTGGQRVNRY